MSEALLSAQGIGKRFGSVVANEAVDLTLRAGEIHALLGENGAGKSTLVKILYGALLPDTGTISWEGQPVRLTSPAAARRLGIGMVFQHFSLFEALTVGENIALSLGGGERMKALGKRIAALSGQYGLPVDPDKVIADLSVGERQRVEVVRCLLQDPKLIILDEPTSVLTPQEAEELFGVLGRLAGEGRAILYISHRLEEVRRIAQRATVMRRGRVVGTCDPRTETTRTLARMMIGSDLTSVVAPVPPGESAPVRLAVRGLSLARGIPFGVDLEDISVEVRAGEVVGIAGVAGNGQNELFQALAGERGSMPPGTVEVDGKDAAGLGITERRRLGLAFVPEERLGHGVVPDMRLSQNVVLTRHRTDPELRRGVTINVDEARAVAARVVYRFGVRAGEDDPVAGALSGGNVQKFQVGREIDRRPAVLVINQPTWGIDAGAAVVVRQAIVDLARTGSAVLMISQDLDEIFEISDRVGVMADGRLTPLQPTAELTPEAIGLMMAGMNAAESPAPADAH
ncbi:MAG: ABC transporter ATP-binding protein [Bauldia sp.]|nr:ABC transporter ATP-binding protein [Bauldia sp.]